MHPKNGLKLTGNTHLHDIMDDMGDDDAQMLLIEEERVYADGYTPPPVPKETIAALQEEPSVPEPSRVQRLERQAGRVGGRAPGVLMVSGLLLGWMAVRLLRRR